MACGCSGYSFDRASGAGTLSSPLLGNTIVVDQVFGNDTTGALNGLPFLTVNAAVSYLNGLASIPAGGVTIWILPGSYVLSAGITVRDSCSLRGLSVQTTRITWAATVPGGTATMLTMGENSRVEDLTFTLTSTDATTNLIGVNTPGATSNSSKLRTAVISVNNSSVAVGATTNVYGILDNGNGVLGPSSFSFNFTRGVTINVASNGAGRKRAVYVTTENDISFRDTNFYVAAPVDAASTGSYVGVETTNDNADVEFRTCSISGPSTAGGYTGSDILQTAPTVGTITDRGIQLGPGCDLIHKTAGGKPFTTYVTPTTIIYGLQGNVSDAVRYYWPGVQNTADATQVFYRFPQKSILQGMSINLRVAPGGANSIVVTVLKSTTGVVGSGVATVMTATISGASKEAFQYGVSVDFAQGEYLAVQTDGIPVAGAAADMVIELDLF